MNTYEIKMFVNVEAKDKAEAERLAEAIGESIGNGYGWEDCVTGVMIDDIERVYDDEDDE